MKKTIICYIATLTRGGAERVMTGLAGYMANNDCTVYLVTLEREEGLYPLDERIRQVVMTDIGPVKASVFEDCGVKYISEDKKIPKYTQGVRRYMAALGRIFYLRRFIKQTGARVILSFMGKTNLRAILAAIRTDCRSYVSVRSAPEKEYPGFVRGMMAKLLFCLADGVVFQSRGASEFFPRLCRRKSRIILNPLDEAFFEAFDGTVTSRREIVTAGRLSEIKNHELLIKAFARFHRKYPDYRLIIYGEGECREALEKLIAELGIEDSALLPGDISDIRELRDKMRGAAMFVISSDFEGMPNAMAEAFALGIPVVATNAPSGGIRTLIGHDVREKEAAGNADRMEQGCGKKPVFAALKKLSPFPGLCERGLLVPVGRERPMALAMKRLADDPGLCDKLTRNGIEFAAGLHPDIIRKQWLDFITEKLLNI